MAKLEIRKAYDEFSPSFVQLGIYEDNSGESFVQQSDADSCDINKIVARYIRDGLITSINRLPPKFGDFSEIADYAEAARIVRQTEEGFDLLPAEIRAKFMNDPGQFIDFIRDPANEKEAYEMGLMKEGYVPSYLRQDAEGGAEAKPEGEQLPT